MQQIQYKIFFKWLRVSYPELFDILFRKTILFTNGEISIPIGEQLPTESFISVAQGIQILESKMIVEHITNSLINLKTNLKQVESTQKFKHELNICAEATKNYRKKQDEFTKIEFFPALLRVFNNNASENDLCLLKERFAIYDKVRSSGSFVFV